jgi:hypothetical protein
VTDTEIKRAELERRIRGAFSKWKRTDVDHRFRDLSAEWIASVLAEDPTVTVEVSRATIVLEWDPAKRQCPSAEEIERALEVQVVSFRSGGDA